MDNTILQDIHRPYRYPDAIIRVENSEPGVESQFEIISEVHSPILDEHGSLQSPSYLRHAMHAEISKTEGKLRAIPIRVEFDQPEHVLRAQFVKWNLNEQSFPECVGNGVAANKVNLSDNTQSKVRCLGPSRCALGREEGNPCMIDVRLNAIVKDKPVEIRCNSLNGFLAMVSGLEYAKAKANGVLSAAKLNLVAWEKSTRGSKYESFTTMRVDYDGVEVGAQPVTKHMNDYALKLSMEWEQRFAFSVLDVQQLPLPVAAQVVPRNYAKSATNTQPRVVSMESLFDLPTLPVA
ncbi:hypothetical protein KXJ72_17900 (plasmid) [Comamonas aquatica]|nr:hypothetical protein KXJ72_17900 [Comamonas aquatica]